MILGDEPNCSREEIKIAVKMKYPVMVVKGSWYCDKLISHLREAQDEFDEEFQEELSRGKFYI